MDYGRFLICPRDKLQSVGSFVVPENMIDVFWTWVLRCQAFAIVGFWLFKELTIHRSWDAFLSFSKTTKRSRHKKGVEVKSFLKEPSNGLSSPHTARIKWFISSDTLKAQKATFCEINLKRSTWSLKNYHCASEASKLFFSKLFLKFPAIFLPLFNFLENIGVQRWKVA